MNNIKYNYYIDQIIDLHNKGYSPIQMEKVIEVSQDTSKKWLIDKGYKPNKFNKELDKSLVIDFTNDDIKELHSKGLSDLEIGVKLKLSRRRVCRIRTELGLAKNNESVKTAFERGSELSDFVKQALIGMVLGDAYVKMNENQNASVQFGHSIKQEAYLLHKKELFKEISSDIQYYNSTLKEVVHKCCRFKLFANSNLNWYRTAFYIDGVKDITKEALEGFTETSLAYHFMDDGSKNKTSYTLSTYGYSLEGVNRYRTMLAKRFGIKSSVTKAKTIYIKKESKDLFKQLIDQYIIPSMRYKLH